MKFGTGAMDDIIEKISNGKLRHIDCVIVGDNASGKSLMLKKFIEKVEGEEWIYFIDAVNRGIDVKKVSRLNPKPGYNNAILETRLKSEYFNIADSFDCFGTKTERAEMIYGIYQKEVQDLFFRITGEKFQILEGNPFGEVDFGNGKGLLSSGHQAMIRIILELLFYQDTMITEKSEEKAWVVIDEIDEFLSPKYSGMILEFLKKEFPWAKWLVTTHSCDLVVHSRNANLIVLDDGKYEVMDIDDYDCSTDVQIIFDRLFGTNAKYENETEQILRRLLNNKINQAWGREDEDCLSKLLQEQLSASQQIILKQIQEW